MPFPEVNWKSGCSVKWKAHLLDSPLRGKAMRTLRTIIMGSMMIIPGLVLGLIVWYILGKPMDNGSPGVILACNAIPLASVLAGIYFGWQTGEEYSATYEG